MDPTYILLMNLSLLIGLPFLPLASLGVSVHISFTFSRTMLQCLSKALTRARSFLLFRMEIRTCVWLRTAVCRIERGPAENSSVGALRSATALKHFLAAHPSSPRCVVQHACAGQEHTFFELGDLVFSVIVSASGLRFETRLDVAQEVTHVSSLRGLVRSSLPWC